MGWICIDLCSLVFSDWGYGFSFNDEGTDKFAICIGFSFCDAVEPVGYLGGPGGVVELDVCDFR